ncbi:hypothetical protein AC231_02745 [Clostridium pasteurianum]|uniref:DUF4351 domain-containing protein n=1 Tax=Clostridium pasteurianum TaxID=1501 RepID=UPI0002A75B23|nr:DUF4351 domain-containing protein [Clostridium pasteurianum]AOZ75154.1 hypothetical protein AQ983_08700 [Clostridium pasteurianum DSM 525 = ATCC 6013]AOZ78949.1 hypothetical protein AQ984_08690 [Clostridium pasteurianum]ELP59766.1 hypothetical protein F502_07873 [Clostridium pasteurianum DSM 525 = ATCC 6013]OMH22589.1 hypothetical protein AC231_02745 [Clostridium pasteurianum]
MDYNKVEDIKRFLYYDASIFYRENKKVRTIVVYSSDIENVEECVDAGTIKYRIEPFYMINIDGDEKLEYLKNKIQNKEKLTKEDMMVMTFLPLMRGRESRSERAIKSIELAQSIEDNGIKLECISMLYALLDKFGDKVTKKKLKEMITMTEIGKMIREEAIEEGIEKGKTKGKSELIIKLLIKKFNKIPKNYTDKINNLSNETLDIIATDIFDMDKIDELEKYF